MVDRLAELGALQYAAANTATASVNPSRIAASGYIHAMYAEYVTWSLANPGVNPSRLSAKGRIFGYFYDNATFSPLSLFAASEVGAWYDPSDLSTMFQDSAGTTPVTADGQPVGLILDKSNGLALGAELVVNGDFTVGTGWTLSSATISGGMLVCSAGISLFLATQPVIFGTPKYFYLTVTISGYVSGSAFVVFGVGDNVSTPDITANGTYTFRVLSGSGNSELRIVSGGSGFVGNVDNISIKELPGNHATQATAASRPLKTSTGAAYWTNYDAVDDVLNTTFPSSLGSSCTVCRANVGAAPTILTAQTIGTSYADSTDNAGLIIINRALTGQETTDVTAWLLAKGATA